MPTVLVVDDDSGTRDGFECILRRHGHAVVTASTGEEALPILEHQPIHLALVDMRLPRMSGVEVLRRATLADVRVPFVMMTGFGIDQLAVEAMQLGARDFVEKPIFVEALLDLVNRFAGRGMVEPAEARTVTTSPSSLSNMHVAKASLTIAEEFSNPSLGLSSIAKRRSISSAHLARLFMRVTGETLETRLRRIRLEFSKTQLNGSDVPVHEIARSSGYNDPSAFSADFKRTFGTTPREYRRLSRDPK